MDVLAFLPAPLLSHLRVVLGTEHTLLVAESLWHFEDAMRRRPVDVAVVDPSMGGTAHAAALAELLGRFPTVPVVVYTRLTPSALAPVVELSRRGAPHVVLHRYDDEPSRFRELLERQSARALTEAMLDRLEPALGALSPALARALERLFRNPHAFFSAQDLARAAGMTVRTVYRQCDAAGLASPRLLVVGARLLRGYQHLREPAHSIEEVAEKLGYSAPRIFTRHARLALGATPRDVRLRLQPTDVLARLERILFPGRTLDRQSSSSA